MKRKFFLLTFLTSLLFFFAVLPVLAQGEPTPAGDDDSAAAVVTEAAAPGEDLTVQVNVVVSLLNAWIKAEPGPGKAAAAILFFGALAGLIVTALERFIPKVRNMPKMARQIIGVLLAMLPIVSAGVGMGEQWWMILIECGGAAATAFGINLGLGVKD